MRNNRNEYGIKQKSIEKNYLQTINFLHKLIESLRA